MLTTMDNETLSEFSFYDYSFFNWSHGIGVLDFNQSTTISREYESLFDVPLYLVIVLSACYGVISVFAVIGNILVIWIVATSRRMQTVTNCFIANLSWADILIGVFVVPFQYQAALLQKWILPAFMCAFCPFVQILSVSVSVFTLTAIALDRHKAILHPLSARGTKLNAKLTIIAIWSGSLILATPMLIALRVVLEEERDVDNPLITYRKNYCANINFSSKTMMTYRMILFLLQYIIPLCIISFVYTRMAIKLWGSKTPGNAQQARDINLMKNKKKVIKMLHVVVLLFALCWLPLQVYNVLQEIFPQVNQFRYINIIFFVCDWLAMSNSCYNPFIYGIYNDKFKREFKLRLIKAKKANQNQMESFDMNHSVTMKYSNGIKPEQKIYESIQTPIVSYSMHYCSQKTQETNVYPRDTTQTEECSNIDEQCENTSRALNTGTNTYHTLTIEPKKQRHRKITLSKNSVTVKRKDNILCIRKYNNKPNTKKLKINENIFTNSVNELCSTKFKMESKYTMNKINESAVNMEFEIKMNSSKHCVPYYRGVIVKRANTEESGSTTGHQVEADVFIFPSNKDSKSSTQDNEDKASL